MWKKLIIQSIGNQSQPQHYQTQTSPKIQTIEFFKKIFNLAEDIPSWEFSFAGHSCNEGYLFQALVESAQQRGHRFSLVLGHQDLYQLDKYQLGQSCPVQVVLDEAFVPYLEMSAFYTALAWAKQKNMLVSVQVNLSESLLQKVIENLLLPRLLELVEKIIFHVPKDEHHPCLTRDQFGFFLDYIAYKMLRMRVLKKIEIDACMVPALSLVPRKKFTQCTHQNALTILSDGGLKICPYGPVIETIEQPGQFQTMKVVFNKKRYRQLLAHCSWREDWNLQEGSKRYKLNL